MKRLLIICAVMMVSASAFAQKANVKKVKNKVEYSSTPIAYDFSNLEADKVAELRELIEPALTNPESKDMADTWKYACRLKVWEMNQLLKQYQANNNTFPDPNAFFQNQYDVVSYYETYVKMMKTPDAKGKLPYKEEEMAKEITTSQLAAKGARGNLLIAARNVVYTDPAAAKKYLDLYYESADNPLFEGLNLKETDPNMPLGYYIYAVTLKQTGGDEATYVKYLEKSLTTDQGPIACQDLITFYKEKKDVVNERKMLEYGFEKFPSVIVFGVNLIQMEFQDAHYDKCIELCNNAIERIETGVAPSENEKGEKIESNKWPYYFKAAALYNQGKREEAYNAFLKANEINENIDNLSGAANCCAMLATQNATNAAVSKKWYGEAIKLYEECRTKYPDRSDIWGYQLYVCYNNTNNVTKANQFKKYSNNK